MFKRIRHKIVNTGNVIETFSFSRPYIKGYSKKPYVQGNQPTDHKSTVCPNNYNRAKTQVKRLLNSNMDLRFFITLTFAENRTNVKECNIDFDRFMKRLKRSQSKELKYLAVIEFQQRGAVHYHVLLNTGLPAKYLERIWSHGFVKITYVKDMNGSAKYISKYMTKHRDERMKGQKAYFTSRNIKKPQILEFEHYDELEFFLDGLFFQYSLFFEVPKNAIVYQVFFKKEAPK